MSQNDGLRTSTGSLRHLIGSKFLAMPAELLVMVLTDLSVPNLLACKRVCRDLRCVIEDSVRLEYKIELFASGMMDGPPDGLTTGERLARLKQYQDAWKNLNFAYETSMSLLQDHDISVSGGSLLVHGLSGAIRKNAELIQVPCAIRDVPEKRMKFTLGDIRINVLSAFEVDPAQDLMVIVLFEGGPGEFHTIRINIRSLRTEGAHPLAAKPAILSAAGSDFPMENYIRIQSNVIAIQTRPAWIWLPPGDDIESILQLWNWKTGDCIWKMTSMDPFMMLSSFEFFDHHHILVFVFDQLFVYAFDADTPVGHVLVEDYLCAFLLPESADPSTTYVLGSVATQSTSYSSLATEKPVPFQLSRNNQLYVMRLHRDLREADIEDHHYFIFVPSSTIAKCIAQSITDNPKKFSWSEWGPWGTRMIHADKYDPELMCVLGSKAVLAYHTSRSRVKLRLDVFDFSPGAGRPEAASSPERRRAEKSRKGSTTTTIVRDPTAIKQLRSGFREEITTCIPYKHMDKAISSRSRTVSILMMPDGVVAWDAGYTANIFAV